MSWPHLRLKAAFMPTSSVAANALSAGPLTCCPGTWEGAVAAGKMATCPKGIKHSVPYSPSLNVKASRVQRPRLHLASLQSVCIHRRRRLAKRRSGPRHASWRKLVSVDALLGTALVHWWEVVAALSKGHLWEGTVQVSSTALERVLSL